MKKEFSFEYEPNGFLGICQSPIEDRTEVHKKRSVGYRTADLVLNKFDILGGLSYMDDEYGMPIMCSVNLFELPKKAIAFSKALANHNYDQMVHFYESDCAFARILHNPKRYSKMLSKYPVVIAPDFSQKVGYPRFICIENNWSNKAIGAYLQSIGITVIPNVTWSTPDSYSYALSGIPKNSVIAINSTGVVSNPASIYLWRKGYDKAIEELTPTRIIRYGNVMPGEYADISAYYDNINLQNLRNGSKRIFR
jgi:hypothetical protein